MKRRAEKTAGKQRGRPWPKGRSGNPAGRPKGARNRATMLAESFLESETEALVRTAVALALDGDTVALRLCLERIIPPKRERAVKFALPGLKTAADIPAAVGRIVEAVSAGELLPGEGDALAAILEQHRKAIETTDLEARIAAMEERLRGRSREPETAS